MPPAALAPSPPAPAAAPSRTARLAWLDALRGIAALLVAMHHSTYHFMPGLRRATLQWFDPGTYGVLVFFLVSGYIIPASLERGRDVRRFWIGRLFRIYPLWLVASTTVVLLALTGLKPLRGELHRQGTAGAVLAHGSMLQDLLATPNVLNVLWTLSYEMAFYLLAVALFVVGLHRRSAGIAIGLALAGVALGGVLPAAALSRALGTDLVAWLAPGLMAVAIGCAVTRRSVPRVGGAVLGGMLALLLVTVNGRVGPWEGILILAVMFTGTVVYRAEHRQIRPLTAWLVALIVPACALGGALWHMEPGETTRLAWCAATVLAGVTFGVGMALRHRQVPRWLSGLGVVSYSVYLLHPVLLMVTDVTIGRRQRDAPLLELAFLLVLVPVSRAAHRYVEAPGQRLGHRLARGRSAQPPSSPRAAHESLGDATACRPSGQCRT